MFKKPLTLDEIREKIPNFMPPQLYYVLDSKIELKNILEEQSVGDKLFVHNHNKIYYDNLAMSVSDLEKTKEFKELDLYYSDSNMNI